MSTADSRSRSLFFTQVASLVASLHGKQTHRSPKTKPSNSAEGKQTQNPLGPGGLLFESTPVDVATVVAATRSVETRRTASTGADEGGINKIPEKVASSVGERTEEDPKGFGPIDISLLHLIWYIKFI